MTLGLFCLKVPVSEIAGWSCCICLVPLTSNSDSEWFISFTKQGCSIWVRDRGCRKTFPCLVLKVHDLWVSHTLINSQTETPTKLQPKHISASDQLAQFEENSRETISNSASMTVYRFASGYALRKGSRTQHMYTCGWGGTKSQPDQRTRDLIPKQADQFSTPTRLSAIRHPDSCIPVI